MGEAKAKAIRHGDLLERQPLCIYCGGETKADTIDHVPAITIFRGRQRPKGLEFSACRPCNRGASAFELPTAVLARVYPPPTTAEEEKEVAQLLVDATRRNPGLDKEIEPRPDQIASVLALGVLPTPGVLNVSGPIVQNAVNKYTAKLGLALHHAVTGRIVPKSGGVAVRWYTNYNQITHGIPEALLEILGPPASISQGKMDVSDQFKYAYAVANTKRVGIYFSTFNFSIATVSYVHEDRSSIPDLPDMIVLSPGFITQEAKSTDG